MAVRIERYSPNITYGQVWREIRGSLTTRHPADVEGAKEFARRKGRIAGTFASVVLFNAASVV